MGYRGTRNLIFDVGNLLIANAHEPTPETWIPKLMAQSNDLVTLQCPCDQYAFLRRNMKVAFATEDGQHVNAHFGWAKKIAIYEISPEDCHFVNA